MRQESLAERPLGIDSVVRIVIAVRANRVASITIAREFPICELSSDLKLPTVCRR